MEHIWGFMEPYSLDAPTESTFDFRNPDYGPILQARVERLSAIREDPALLAALKVVDWG